MNRSFSMLFLALIPVAAPCATQPSNVIGVVRVAFNEPDLDRPERLKDYTLGTSLILALRQKTSLPDNFHARFFTGSKDDLIRYAHARADTEGCVWFPSSVLQVRRGASLEFYSSLTDEWLGKDGSPQTYTVVFEAGDQPSDLNIRLYYPDLASRYFADAIQIRVNRDPQSVAFAGPFPKSGTAGSGGGGKARVGTRPVADSSKGTGSRPITQPIQRPTESRCWTAQLNASQKAPKVSATFVTSWMVGGSCEDLRRETVEKPRAVGE
jgi:hypothetical protein